MKRIFSFVLIMALMLQTMFVNVVKADGIIHSLDMEDIPKTVSGIKEGNIAEAITDEDEPYVSLKNVSGQTPVFVNVKDLPANDKVSITTAFRRVKGNPSFIISSNGQLVLSLTMSASPYYYDKGDNVTNMNFKENEWSVFTLVIDFNTKTMDMYQDGWLANEDVPFRNEAVNSFDFAFSTNSGSGIEFDIKSLTVHSGEVVPEISAEMEDRLVFPERTLVDYTKAPERLEKALADAVAMTVGNSVARVNNKYISIDPDNVYVAPFVTEDGYTLIPTRFTTEAIGCTTEVLSSTSFRFSKDGTVMEINMGDKYAVINGESVEMPTTPVIKYDRLFIPLRFAAETFGKNVFWDDRGLIVISSTPVVSSGDEDIIKPLISDIRSHTTIHGNKKYSDVPFSARFMRSDGHTTNTDTPQWGTIDASKRFMTTVNRWSYLNTGENNKILTDLGYLNQGTLNANYTNSERASSYFYDGTAYTRADGVNGTTWACLSDPEYYENILDIAKKGIDNGMFVWQFDDWALNHGYRLGGCFCDFCMKDFTKYIVSEAPDEIVSKTGIDSFDGFNYKEYLKTLGVKENSETLTHSNSALRELWTMFHINRVKAFHARLKSDMEQYSGSEIDYSVNTAISSAFGSNEYSYIIDYVNGFMGETAGGYTTAEMIMAAMLVSRGIGIENVISPLPHSKADRELMYSAIPMTYATGQFMLVPWDNYLSGSLRYYATLEELGGVYELPREYPFLFDNYEIPEHIGYVYDLDTLQGIGDVGSKVLEKGLPARVIANINQGAAKEIDAESVRGLQAVITDSETFEGLSEKEQNILKSNGVPLCFTSDADTVTWLENTYRTVTDNNSNVYTVLRQNMLYDNAPTVVHAVNYGSSVQEKVEIDVNNLYLPSGDTFTVNIYRPGENVETITVSRGGSSTKILLDEVSLWTVLEICGPSTVRREVKFNISTEFNGIGLGTRMSNDKAFGTPEDFTIITYGEGINSTTYGDVNGAQDEGAFVYKRFGPGKVRKAVVSAGFDDPDGTFGVMVREGIYSNARFAALMYDSENGLRIAKRNIANKRVDYTKISDEKPSYMKLERNGNEFYAYVSNDGTTYTQVGAVSADFADYIGGVFAASPDGRRSECRVKDFISSRGGYPSESFAQFRISCGSGKLDLYEFGKKLVITLDTDNYTNLTVDDVDISFESSNENVVKVTSDGILVPTGVGNATISAVAAMGLRKITASCSITVTEADPVTFEESFDGNAVPSYMEKNNEAIKVENGVLKALTDVSGKESDVNFNYNLRELPTAYEFDFKAHFGNDGPTTGARVIYANGNAVSLTCDRNGFNWFFGSAQTKIAPIEEDKWYHIKIEIDYDTQKANVYIDGELVVENAEGRNAFTVNGAATLGGWRLGKDTCYEWDNIKCYSLIGEE